MAERKPGAAGDPARKPAGAAPAESAGSRPSRRVFWIDLGVMLVSTALWAASFHPLDLWFLSWVALVPWIVRSRPISGVRRRFGLQWVIGQFLLHMSVLAWVGEVAPPLVVAIPFLGIPFSWMTGRLLSFAREKTRLPTAVSYPLIIVCCEVLRDRALLGLTWASLGYPQARWIHLIQLASVGRVHLVALVVIAVNALLAEAWIRRREVRGWVRPVVRAAALLGAAEVAGFALLPRDSVPGPLVAGAQTNIPQRERLGVEPAPYDRNDPAARDRERQRVQKERSRRAYAHLKIQYDLANEARKADPDMLVFPETSFPSVREPGESLEKRLQLFAHSPDDPAEQFALGGVTLQSPGKVTVLGLIRGRTITDRAEAQARGWRDDDDEGSAEWNVAWIVRGGHPTDEIYEKRLLCPFGEYIPTPPGTPGRATLKRLILENAGYIPDLTAGERTMVFDVPSPGGVVKASPTICFEMVFPDFFRDGVRAGADFLVNISNDAWFEGSSELELVDAAGIFRAVECSRSLFRVSNSGVSTLIGPDGRRLAVVENSAGRRTEVRGLLLGRVPISRRVTPYVRFGDWPWLGVSALLLILLGRGKIRPA